MDVIFLTASVGFMNQLGQKVEQEPAKPRSLLTEPGVGYRVMGENHDIR